MKLRVKALHRNAALPQRGTAGAAGLDLYTVADSLVMPNAQPVAIGTGLAVEIPPGHVGLLTLRSSAAMRGLYMPNSPGVIDSDYRGEIKVLLCTTQPEGVRIQKGTRLAQLLIMPYRTADATWVDDLGETARGTGGLGSTGC